MKLELYPISFLGLAIGQQNIRSDFEDFNFYDCDKVRCIGNMRKDYGQIRLALAFKGVTFVGLNETYFNNYNDPSGDELPVAEFRFAVRAQAKRDKSNRSQYILGYQWDQSMLALVTDKIYFEKSDQFHEMNLLAYQSRKENLNSIFGIGSFESTDQDKGFIAVFQIIYTPKPSFRLF